MKYKTKALKRKCVSGLFSVFRLFDRLRVTVLVAERTNCHSERSTSGVEESCFYVLLRLFDKLSMTGR